MGVVNTFLGLNSCWIIGGTMFISRIILSTLCLSLVFGQYDYSLEDLNSTSNYFGDNVGTSYFPDQVTLHYFGHYNWGTCTARFGQLNDLYQDLVSNGYDQVKLIGVGKTQHMNWLSNWTDDNDASVCADQSGFAGYAAWNEWEASQRDLYILDQVHSVISIYFLLTYLSRQLIN